MKSHVSMEKKVCPVCSAQHETGVVLMDKHMRNVLETYTLTGWGMCPECQSRHLAGYVALVAIDTAKSGPPPYTLESVYRLGTILHVRGEALANIITGMEVRNNKGKFHEMMFVDQEVIDKLMEMRPKE